MISSLHKVIVISMLSALKYIYIIRSADCNKQPERSGLFNNGKYDLPLFYGSRIILGYLLGRSLSSEPGSNLKANSIAIRGISAKWQSETGRIVRRQRSFTTNSTARSISTDPSIKVQVFLLGTSTWSRRTVRLFHPSRISNS